jgi:hypothetical protein
MEQPQVTFDTPIYTVMPNEKTVYDLQAVFMNTDTNRSYPADQVAESIEEYLDVPGGFYLDVEKAEAELDGNPDRYILRFYLDDVSRP